MNDDIRIFILCAREDHPRSISRLKRSSLAK
jgi:hypothetical protein